MLPKYKNPNEVVMNKNTEISDNEKFYNDMRVDFETKSKNDSKEKLEEIKKFIILLLKQNSENLKIDNDHTSFSLFYEKKEYPKSKNSNSNINGNLKTQILNINRFTIRIDLNMLSFDSYMIDQNSNESYVEDRFYIDKDLFLELKDIVYDAYIKHKHSKLDNFLNNSYRI